MQSAELGRDIFRLESPSEERIEGPNRGRLFEEEKS